MVRSGKLLLQVGHHELDQEVAERDAAQALLAVADRVEDGAVGSLRVLDGAVVGDQRLDGARQAVDQRHLDEDQRLVRQGRVEEGKAAAVGGEPALQVLQMVHAVDLLVAQELLQQRGRAVPVDPGER